MMEDVLSIVENEVFYGKLQAAMADYSAWNLSGTLILVCVACQPCREIKLWTLLLYVFAMCRLCHADSHAD